MACHPKQENLWGSVHVRGTGSFDEFKIQSAPYTLLGAGPLSATRPPGLSGHTCGLLLAKRHKEGHRTPSALNTKCIMCIQTATFVSSETSASGCCPEQTIPVSCQHDSYSCSLRDSCLIDRPTSKTGHSTENVC